MKLQDVKLVIRQRGDMSRLAELSGLPLTTVFKILKGQSIPLTTTWDKITKAAKKMERKRRKEENKNGTTEQPVTEN